MHINSCRECKQPLNPGASKCHHCQAHQNWFRFLWTSAAIATFALTGISILLAPPIKELLETKQAVINVSILEGDFRHTTFMVANTGNEPAGLISVIIVSKLRNGPAFWTLDNDFDRRLLEPGKAYVIKAENGRVLPAPVSHEMKAMLAGRGVLGEENCHLEVSYVQMSGTKITLGHPYHCDSIDPANPPIDPLK